MSASASKIVKVSGPQPPHQNGHTLTVEHRNGQGVDHHFGRRGHLQRPRDNQPAESRIPGIYQCSRVLPSSEVKTRQDFFIQGDHLQSPCRHPRCGRYRHGHRAPRRDHFGRGICDAVSQEWVLRSTETSGSRSPPPTRVRDDGTWVFPDTGRPKYEEAKNIKYKPTVVVCCTGYDRTFPFLDEKFQPTLDQADVSCGPTAATTATTPRRMEKATSITNRSFAYRPVALEIMRGELFDVTLRLGGFVFFFWY
ncbi:dimethylaniline monooxygenase [Apiospora phragmitis]|uniref:Dimethylaniline monooxygenase n=1 Tax=Apiospora phragmitis TaxID=2905665 RepID=A0ABR1WTS0_9PEZI